MVRSKKGVKTKLHLNVLDSLAKHYSATDRNRVARKYLFTEGLKPIVKYTGWLDYTHMLNRQGEVVWISDDLSVEMRRMIMEGEYPWIISKDQLFRIL